MTLSEEIRDVARRIALETGRTSDQSGSVRSLRAIAMRLHRSYETACNREQSKAELAAEEADEKHVRDICEALGVKVRFNGDPRGAPVQILCKREYANSSDGECIVVPYLASHYYRETR